MASLWNTYIQCIVFLSDYILPADSYYYWIALLMFNNRCNVPYTAYVYSGYIWLDVAIAEALSVLTQGAFGTSFQYCKTSHFLGSFFACLVTDSYLLRVLKPIDLIGAATFLYGFVASISLAGTSPAPDIPALRYGSCHTSIGGLFVSLAIGAAIGLLRMTFYIDLSRLHRRFRGCKHEY